MESAIKVAALKVETLKPRTKDIIIMKVKIEGLIIKCLKYSKDGKSHWLKYLDSS